MAPHQDHGVEELCEAGLDLYGRALREGGVREQDADAAACLIDHGMLHPDPQDLRWLRPIAPAVALPKLLQSIEEGITQQRSRGTKLAEVFEPLMALDAERTAPAEASLITVLTGFERISAAIYRAASAASQEMLTIQPGGTRNPTPESLDAVLTLEQRLLARGARMRTLYQHTSRHSAAVVAHYEQLDGDIEVRTLDEVTERLIILDRAVAFIPATKDRTVALEVRYPALVSYFVNTFERLWRMSVPMYPQASPQPSLNGITPRQQAIAGLLVEGLTDTAIAERLGLNVRTARVHIAKLAAILGSESRAQLGYLIGRSGILDQEH
jgi:DNA-binding NarL/FixJ family response regulator